MPTTTAQWLAEFDSWGLRALFVCLVILTTVCAIGLVYSLIERAVIGTRYGGQRAVVGVIGLVLAIVGIAGVGYGWQDVVGTGLPPFGEQAYEAFPWAKYDWKPLALTWGAVFALAAADYFAFLYLRSEVRAERAARSTTH